MRVKVEITNPSGKTDNINLENVPPKKQESLLEWVEDASQLLSYGCRVGSCGTCMVEVLAGAECLEDKTPQEIDTLGRMATSERSRLACRAQIKAGVEGTIRIKTHF